MPGGNDSEFNALVEIACQSGLMASAAGGTPFGGGYATEDDLVFAIACNFRATFLGLGGTSCDPGFVDTDTAWQAILLYSAQLTGITGTPLNAGNMQSPLFGIMCDLGQVAENTGQAAAGLVGGSYLNLLNSIACALGQVVTNGFGQVVPPPENLNASSGINSINLNWDPPPGPTPDSNNIYRSTVNGGPYTLLANIGGGFVAYDDNTAVQGTTYYYVVTSVIGGHESGYSNQASAAPLTDLQIFINALVGFNPDVLLVGDVVSGASVTSWPDQSGNGADGGPTPGATAPTRNVASVNGHDSVLFNGTTDEIEGAYVNTSQFSSVFVVFRNTVAGNGPTYVTTAKTVGGGDATVGQPVLCYDGSATPETNAYYGGGGAARAASSLNQFRLACAFTDGINGTVYDSGANIASIAYTGPLDTTLYCLGNTSNLSGTRGLAGDIAFAMMFKTDETANRLAISALVNGYYGL